MADAIASAAFGAYSGTDTKTDRSMSATFAHLYRLKDGKIQSMEQHVDSALTQQAMTATPWRKQRSASRVRSAPDTPGSSSRRRCAPQPPAVEVDLDSISIYRFKFRYNE